MNAAAPRSDQAARRPWRVVRALSAAALAAVLAFAAGFVWFLRHVPADEVAIERNADGIVVVTGGASRVADAMELLAAGRGKRLLISGVHRSTNLPEIARLVPRFERLVACCVDLDHSAVNTVGNAVETRRWARELGFRSLIVVTSSYHMPRTLAELARQLPEIELVAFPVVTDRLRAEPWWTNGVTARLLFSEYVKFVFAQVRMRIESAPGWTDAAGGRTVSKI